MTTRVRIFSSEEENVQRPSGGFAAIPRGPLMLIDLLAHYEARKLRGKSTGTVGQYITAINHLREFLRDRDPTTDDLTDKIVSDFMWAMVERRGIAPDTTVSYTKKLLALWRFACRHHVIDNWPEVDLMKIPAHDPVAWSRDELRQLFGALRTLKGEIGGFPAADFWIALLLVFYDSAERLGAVLSLQTTDVNLAGAWITFRASTRKGRLRDRGMPIHPETVQALAKIMEGKSRRRMLFELPFSEQTLRLKYKAILRDAGLPFDRKRLFHCVRKSVASHWESLGFDATELLDHSMRKVTTDSYLSPQIVKRPRPADSLFRPEAVEGKKRKAK